MTREYQPLTVHELAACTCDRCKRRLTPDEPGEWQERLSFDHSCGFDSVFGDRNTVSLDLCQHCVREVLGQWLHIATPVSVADMNAAIAEEASKGARRFGGLKGRVRVQRDFDAPLSLSPDSKKKLKKRP